MAALEVVYERLKSVDLDYFRKNVTSALTSSDEFLTVPTDYLASFSLQITTSGSESFLIITGSS